MLVTADKLNDERLPREMQQHTYAIMRRVEESHWWFVGRRQIIKSFLKRIVSDLESDRSHDPLHILDVGCGTGANLEMLSEFGNAEGVDVSSEALSFCEGRGLKQVKLHIWRTSSRVPERGSMTLRG